jgi:galactokinase
MSDLFKKSMQTGWMPMFDSMECRMLFEKLYGPEEGAVSLQLDRYRRLADAYRTHFGKGKTQLFSTPGRAEIAGNHTDHNGGLVLAASVHLDSIAVAAPNRERKITVFSEGFSNPFTVSIDDLEVKPPERHTTTALIRGIAARIRELGHEVGGFNAFISSNVGIGSGLSSSASLEVLLATIVNHLFNRGDIPMMEIAKTGRYAENQYFQKPCGLMDQIACGFGGVVNIDFAVMDAPTVRKIDFDFSDYGYCMMVVRTGSDHADLTDDYAAITREMRSVAELFGKRTCRELSLTHIVAHAAEIRREVHDRALLRAFHFLTENERVKEQIQALQQGNMDRFLSLVRASGNSSARWLQNSFSPKHPENQPVSVAGALTEYFQEKNGGGAFRVHGGGFAGTIQVFLPEENSSAFIDFMEKRLGTESVTPLRIRPLGSIHINSLL